VRRRSGPSADDAVAERATPRDRLVWQSGVMARVSERIDLAARSRSTVLITGETGTGKELVASALHHRSAERNLPFVKVNTAAIPETLLESELFGHVRGAFTGATMSRRGKFTLAHRGSIFLDEIGAMPLPLQAKLLRVLQEREVEPLGAEHSEPVDVRVIAATNRDLVAMADAGLFLPDLYYRLDVIPIEVPPLRDRREDIPLLAAHFFETHARRNGTRPATLDDRALARLEQYPWPGNIRELENAIERALILTPDSMITADAILLGTRKTRSDRLPSFNLRQNIEWIEQETIRRALEFSPLKRQAAQTMGISPRALAYYLNKYPALAGESQATPRPIPVNASQEPQ